MRTCGKCWRNSRLMPKQFRERSVARCGSRNHSYNRGRNWAAAACLPFDLKIWKLYPYLQRCDWPESHWMIFAGLVIKASGHSFYWWSLPILNGHNNLAHSLIGLKQQTHNLLILGSNPSGPTKIIYEHVVEKDTGTKFGSPTPDHAWAGKGASPESGSFWGGWIGDNQRCWKHAVKPATVFACSQ